MTDRIHSLLIVLEKDIRDDDVQGLANAISQLRGVAGVKMNVADIESQMAETRAKEALRKKLWEVLK